MHSNPCVEKADNLHASSLMNYSRLWFILDSIWEKTFGPSSLINDLEEREKDIRTLILISHSSHYVLIFGKSRHNIYSHHTATAARDELKVSPSVTLSLALQQSTNPIKPVLIWPRGIICTLCSFSPLLPSLLFNSLPFSALLLSSTLHISFLIQI